MSSDQPTASPAVVEALARLLRTIPDSPPTERVTLARQVGVGRSWSGLLEVAKVGQTQE